MWSDFKVEDAVKLRSNTHFGSSVLGLLYDYLKTV